MGKILTEGLPIDIDVIRSGLFQLVHELRLFRVPGISLQDRNSGCEFFFRSIQWRGLIVGQAWPVYSPRIESVNPGGCYPHGMTSADTVVIVPHNLVDSAAKIIE